MRFEIRLPAGEDMRLCPELAQELIGQRLKLNRRANDGGPVLVDYGRATVVEAEVTDDLSAVLLTLDSDVGLVEQPVVLGTHLPLDPYPRTSIFVEPPGYQEAWKP